jgi:hypothetical protein
MYTDRHSYVPTNCVYKAKCQHASPTSLTCLDLRFESVLATKLPLQVAAELGKIFQAGKEEEESRRRIYSS